MQQFINDKLKTDKNYIYTKKTCISHTRKMLIKKKFIRETFSVFYFITREIFIHENLNLFRQREIPFLTISIHIVCEKFYLHIVNINF